MSSSFDGDEKNLHQTEDDDDNKASLPTTLMTKIALDHLRHGNDDGDYYYITTIVSQHTVTGMYKI